MFINKDSNVYLVDRSTNLFKFNFSLSVDLKNTILDGELVHHADGSYEYLIFDILFNNGVEVMSMEFSKRYIESKNVLKNMNDYPGLAFGLKEWFPITDILKSNDIYGFVKGNTNKSRIIQRKPLLVADGLILQPNDTEYIPFREWNGYNNVQFKWKPTDQLTIDFKIKWISDKKWFLLTGTGEQFMVNQKGSDPVPAICEPTEKDRERYSNGEVVEFILKQRGNPQRNLFVPQRSRNEKRANSYRTIMSTLNAIEHSFKLDSLQPAFKSILTLPFTVDSVKKILIHFSESDLVLWSLRFENTMFFNSKEIKSIKEVYSKIPDTPNPEFECRILNFTKMKKSSGMTKSCFFYLLGFFWKHFPIESENTVDAYLNVFSKSKKRSTYASIADIYSQRSISNMTKESVKSYMLVPTNYKKKLYNNLTMKIDLSKEDPSDFVVGVKSQIDGKIVTNSIRVKSRKSFRVNELWRVDFTRTKTSFSISDVLEKNEIYELECEFMGKNIPFDNFIKSLNDLYTLILSNSGYC